MCVFFFTQFSNRKVIFDNENYFKLTTLAMTLRTPKANKLWKDQFGVKGDVGVWDGLLPCSPLAHTVYIVPFLSYLSRWLQNRLHPSDPDVITFIAREAMTSSNGKNWNTLYNVVVLKNVGEEVKNGCQLSIIKSYIAQLTFWSSERQSY